MTKSKKKILTALLSSVVLSIGFTNIMAFASQGSYSFRLGRDNSAYSSSIKKNAANGTGNDFAKIYPTYGTVSGAPMTLTIYNDNHTTAYSNPAYFTSLDIRWIYYTHSVYINEYVCLKGKAGYYYSEMDGEWIC